MYCGTQHSQMGGWVYVMSKADYQKWSTSGGAKPVATGGVSDKRGAPTLAQQGATLFEKYDCAACHGADGVKQKRGPSLAGLYGTVRKLANGNTVPADDAYLRNVLINTDQYVPEQWKDQQTMPSYKGVMNEEEILAVNAYIKALSGKGELTEPAGEQGTEVNAVDTDNQQWRFMYGGEQYK
jgi:cytochrome c oxidase subunit 2